MAEDDPQRNDTGLLVGRVGPAVRGALRGAHEGMTNHPERSSPFAALEERVHRLNVIYELTRTIISVGNVDELLQRVAEEAARAFNATICLIRLAEDGKL